jgi:thiamine biosynthesis lipoprotein
VAAVDPALRRDLRAMSSDIELVCYAPDAERRVRLAERWLRAFEERFSRFRPLSELSRLNAAAGRSVRISPQLFAMLHLALQLAERSGGIFDPTILRDLESAGYDRSFESIDRTMIPPPSDPLSHWERARVRDTETEGARYCSSTPANSDNL